MIILGSPTDKLQIVLGTNSTTNEMSCVMSWENEVNTIYKTGRDVKSTDGTTVVNLISNIPSSERRTVNMISIYNGDTVANTVTIILNAKGLDYVLWKGVLNVGDTLMYLSSNGFNINRTNQNVKSFTVHADAGVSFAMTNATLAERFAGNTTRHLFMVDLLGYTQVRLIVNKQVGSTSINTPLFRAKYYTSYNTTVTNFLQLGAASQIETSMTAIGYYDSGWVDLALGARIDGCCIGFTELGGDGVADPAIGATNILFR